MSIGSEGTVSMGVKVDISEALRLLTQLQTNLKGVAATAGELQSALARGVTSPLGPQIQQIATSTDQASTKTQTFVERMSGFQGSLLTSATSVGTFTASIFGIDAAMDNLTAAELALETQRLRTERTATTLEQTELRLKTGRDNGNLSVEQQEILEQRITTLREREAIETEKLDFMQQNLNESKAQFAAQIMPQVIAATLSGVTAITSIIQTIGKSEKAIKFLNDAWQTYGLGIKTVQTSTASANTAIAATSAAATSASAATGGLVGTMQSLIPILAGIVAGAASVVAPFLLWSENVGGIRVSLSQMGAELGKLNPTMEQFLKWIEDVSREFTGMIHNTQMVSLGYESLNTTFKNVSKGAEGALTMIGDKITLLSEKIAKLNSTASGTTGGPSGIFVNLFGDSSEIEKGIGLMDTLTNVVTEFWSTMEVTEGGSKLTQSQFKSLVNEISTYANGLIAVLVNHGKQVPVELKKIADQATDISKIMAKGVIPEAELLDLQKKFAAFTGSMLANGQSIVDQISAIVQESLDPIGYNIDQIIAKMSGVKLPPELAVEMRSIIPDMNAMNAAWIKNFDVSTTSNEQLMAIATKSLPSLQKEYQKTHPEIDTTDKFLQKLVNTTDKSKAKNDLLTQGLLLVADAYGIKRDVTAENVEKLTEEEQKIADLAKSYLDLNLTSKDSILQYKAQVEWIENAIQKYDDQIEALKEVQIEYGSNEQAVYGVNDATMELIESKKDHIIQEQALTVAAIDVTKALDGSKESQILMNEATIEGTKAAADFVTELVKAEKQTEAYGKALSSNVMDVLKEMPETVGQFADEFRNALPNLFKSLDEFEGKIKPFDKQSIKDYKEELKDLDVPKSLRDLYVDSAKVWQDKDEIIQEGEALFAGMAGSLVHNFENIDVKDVTTFLDEIGGRLEELEAEGIGTQFTDNIRQLIDHIKNSADPVQELRDHFDELKGAMDPQAIDTVSTAMKIFGTHVGTLVQDAVLSDLALQGDDATKSLTALSEVDLTNLLDQIRKAQEIQLNKGTSEGLGNAIDLAIAGGDVATALEGKKGGDPSSTATAWEDAKARIELATTGISTAVTTAMTLIQASISGMSAVLQAEFGIIDAKIVGTQGVFQLFSDSVLSNSTLMQESISGMQAVEIASLQAVDAAVLVSQEAWSQFQTNHAVYTQLMTDNVTTFGETSVTQLDTVDKQTVTSDSAMSKFQTNWAVYMKVMTDQVEAWSAATVEAFKAVEDGAGKAEDAVKGLADAIAALKDKTVTIKVDVQESSTSSQQYGGVKLLTHPQYIFAGEGHKPEIHMTFPLDEMSQSHSTSAFTLPFNLKNFQVPNLSGTKIKGIGNGAAAAGYPSQLNSNIRANLNLNIDLGQQVRQIVKEEINLRSTTRLDRMGFK